MIENMTKKSWALAGTMFLAIASFSFNSEAAGVADMSAIKARKVKSDAGTTNDNSIVGDWYITLGDYYYEIGSLGAYEAFFKATIDDSGLVWFKDPTNYEYPLTAEYDEATGVLTFIRVLQEQWYNDYGKFDYYIFQEPFTYETQGDFKMGDFTAQFDADKGEIIFPAKCGIQWNSYGDTAGNNFLWDEWLCDLVKAVMDRPEEDDPANWKDLGNATFMDGWVLPGIGLDQNLEANHYEVSLQQNVSDENLYRLVNPYKSGPAAMYNSKSGNGYIVFDVTDPDHVLVSGNGVEAGFANDQAEISKLYCYNALAYYSLRDGLTPAETVEKYGDKIPYTTFKDGVVRLSYIINADGRMV